MSVGTEELATLKAHRWQVSCLAFRSDGFRLATAGWDKEVHVWDMVNLEVVTTLKGVHRVPITCLSWQGARGEVLCTGSADNTAVLWDPANGTHTQTLAGHSGWVLGACFSISDSVLATASWDKTIGIWDSSTGQLINTYEGHSEGVWSVDFHPSSSGVLCSGSEDGSVKVWDLREGKMTLNLASSSGHSDAVYCAKWSPDGNMIASGSADTKVCIWDMDSTLLINTIYGHSNTVKSLAFNPNSNSAIPILASAGDCTILLSDPRPTQKAEILSLSPHSPGKEVEAISISPDGSLLVSGGRDGVLAFTTLSLPLLEPQEHDCSASSKLRNSVADRLLAKNDSQEVVDETPHVITEGDSTISFEARATRVTRGSSWEGTGKLSRGNSRETGGKLSRGNSRETGGKLSRGNSRETGGKLSRRNSREAGGKLSRRDSREISRRLSRGNSRSKKEPSARVSRQKRAEKKVVDLPSMIAHLSVQSSVSAELPSSSESEEENEELKMHEKISALIDITHKVDKFSQIAKQMSIDEIQHEVPKPRLSLLPDDVQDTIKEKRKYFQTRDISSEDVDRLEEKTSENSAMSKNEAVESTHEVNPIDVETTHEARSIDVETTHESVEVEYYDGYSSLLPGEPSDTDDNSSYSSNDSFHFHTSSQHHSFVGDEDDYYDEDVPFSMI